MISYVFFFLAFILAFFCHTNLYAEIYNFDGIITNSWFESGCSECEDESGEIQRDGWRIGDKVKVIFNYSTEMHDWGEPEAYMVLEIGGNSTLFPQYGFLTATDGFILYEGGYFDSPGNELSYQLSIKYDFGTSDDSTYSLPNELDLSNIESIIFGYSIASEGYDSYSFQRIGGSIPISSNPVPLPAAGLLMISGLTHLIIRKMYKNGSDQSTV